MEIESRPRSSRATVRVLMLDPQGRVLLLRDSDPGNGAIWWILPGGGIDPGESEVEAVVREIAEETGLDVAAGDVLGPLARREVLHGYTDKIVDQHDTFYLLRVQPFEISTAGHTEEEQLTMLGHRWWAAAELTDADEPIWPVLLPWLLELAERPADWPVALDPVEESSAAV